MPSSIEKYEDFVVNNSQQMVAVEKLLSSLSYLLPGRFQDSEVASEAVFSLSNLISLYHNYILSKRLSVSPHQENDAVRVAHHYLQDPLYRKWALLLTTIQSCELLLEMAVLKKYGRKKSWNFLICIEVVKVLCRLGLLNSRYTNNGPLVEPVVHDMVPELETAASWKGDRTGKGQPPMHTILNSSTPRSVDVLRYLSTRALHSPFRPVQDVLSPLTRLQQMGEFLHILRPLVYVLLLRKYGQRSWAPWLLSLAIESSSYAASLQKVPKSLEELRCIFSKMDSLQAEEYSRRLKYMFYYILRNPFYSLASKPILEGFYDIVRKFPLGGHVEGVIQGYQPFWEKYYFFTSGS